MNLVPSIHPCIVLLIIIIINPVPLFARLTRLVITIDVIFLAPLFRALYTACMSDTDSIFPKFSIFIFMLLYLYLFILFLFLYLYPSVTFRKKWWYYNPLLLSTDSNRSFPRSTITFSLSLSLFYFYFDFRSMLLLLLLLLDWTVRVRKNICRDQRGRKSQKTKSALLITLHRKQNNIDQKRKKKNVKSINEQQAWSFSLCLEEDRFISEQERSQRSLNSLDARE